MKENHQAQTHAEARGLARPPERTGMYTTALVVKVGEQTVCLYYGGRAQVGEHLAALWPKREAVHETLLLRSNALSSNEADETPLIRCHCLAHGRRKFSELEEGFPQECAVVLDVLHQVFDHDEAARGQQLIAQARLASSQVYSGPLMAGL